MTEGIILRRSYFRVANNLAFSFFLFGISMNALSKEYKVGMEGWEFNPASLTIKLGDTVVWINDDDTKHKISFEDKLPGAPTREHVHKFNVGDKFHFKFTSVGKFKYVCTSHEGQDMVGVIIVEEK